MLTGDSLFVGDTARPDLAVGGQEGAEGLFHSLQRLLELSDGVEVFPGHVAGSLCGKSMSSKGSTTIGFERRFNPMLQLTAVDEFIADATAISAPKPPNLARIVDANRGPFVGAAPLALELAAPPDGRPAARRPGRAAPPRRSPARCCQRAGLGIELRHQGGLRARCGPARVRSRRDLRGGPRAIRGLHSVAFFDIAGYVLGGGDETTDAVDVDELEELIADGRHGDRRARGRRARCGHDPRQPRHSLPARWERRPPGDRPVVTICESGARAAIAASVLRARGYDARPVTEGGLTEWRRRGGELVVSGS